jgi:putative transposase
LIITYKYCLKLTKEQQHRIDCWSGVCRLVYNLALEIKIDAYKKGIPISFYDLEKQLPDLKRNIDWIKDPPSSALKGTVQSLEKSYGSFFSGGGFPKFRSKKSFNSIPLTCNPVANDIKQLSKNEFLIPKMGVVKIFKDRHTTGKIKKAIITKSINKYYLCVVCEAETRDLPPCDSQAGVDVGISNFAVLSDGTFVDHPRLTFKYQDELRRQQRKLSRCKIRSNNWYKQVVRIQKLHLKVSNSRLDFLHKVSTKIVRTYGLISVEDLNIRGMVKTNLSKHVSDSGWYTFRQLLKYKSELHGRSFVAVKPKYSSQECFDCGHIDAGNRRSQSIFVCVKCGHEDHADLNASKNLLRRGQRLLAQSTDNSLRLAKELVA